MDSKFDALNAKFDKLNVTPSPNLERIIQQFRELKVLLVIYVCEILILVTT